ncbi:MAG: sulfite exporter TauE/SafE family protein [Kiritimatiellia bacterium]
MSQEIVALALTAASLGFVHTVLGPDHYVPFIAMSKARGWSLLRTSLVTFACGLGHVMSSVLIGIVGIVFGVGVMKLETLEGIRGNIAAWLLMGFGLAYFVWGVHKAIKNRPHRHHHAHPGCPEHSHEHSHGNEHAHAHDGGNRSITPWVLFTIFLFGPCEPLIPLVMYPAAKGSMQGVLTVTAIFGVITIATMMTIVMMSSWSFAFIRFEKAERYMDALAGASILGCGIAIEFAGL